VDRRIDSLFKPPFNPPTIAWASATTETLGLSQETKRRQHIADLLLGVVKLSYWRSRLGTARVTEPGPERRAYRRAVAKWRWT
jgi:hypothetical protein